MARGWAYMPDYALYIKMDQRNTVVSITSLVEADATVTTGAGVNQARLVLRDPGNFLLEKVGRQTGTDRGLHPMMGLQLRTKNRFGQWGICWTGYLDEVHHAYQQQQGETLQLACTGPVKRWEITSTSDDQAQQLANAYVANVAASAVLSWSALAVGYLPGGRLIIDPVADCGSGINPEGPQTAALNPAMQTWAAIIGQLQANSGLEWFFTETGACVWRRVGFLNTQPSYRYVDEVDIISADVFESDSGVITDIEVRYNVLLYTSKIQAVAPGSVPGGPPSPFDASAISNMRNHLGTRRQLIYAPWIIGNAAQAQYLADVLLQQAAANVLQAVIAIPADPLITAGSLIDVPSLRLSGTKTRYYVTSVTYQLTWLGQWVMVLTLAYGRGPASTFPYLGTMAYPQPEPYKPGDGLMPSAAPLALDPANPNKVTLPFAIVGSATLVQNLDGTWPCQCDPQVFPPGSVLALRNAGGQPIGPSRSGEYTTLAGQGGTTLYLPWTHDNQGTITIIHLESRAQESATLSQGDPTQPVPGSQTVVSTVGTGSHTQRTTPTASMTPMPRASSTSGRLAVAALKYALTLSGYPYVERAGGPDAFDCSGLVYYSYAQQGYNWSHMGPNGIYYWFLQHGAKEIDINTTQPGDLLFVVEPQPWPPKAYWATQVGFSHVAFVYSAGGFAAGQNYGADGPQGGTPPTIYISPIGGFKSWNGTIFNRALDMSLVTLSS